MNQRRPLPWPGILLALASGGFMLAAGSDPFLVLAVVVLWIATLWITQPPPQAQSSERLGVKISRDNMRDLIEHSGLPLLLLDRNRILIANSAAREALGPHVVGQDARVALRHPAAVELLDRQGGGSATIAGLTGPRSIWQISRYPVDERYWMVELVNRTAEADISRAHTDFVANASHELRTPLASIIGYMETLADSQQQVDGKTKSRFYEIVLNEARRLESLVDDLMSLSRVEAEKHDQPNERLELNGTSAQAARDAGRPEDKPRIEVIKSDTPLYIRGDRQQIEQLVRNLVDNALKYGAAGEKVTVTLDKDENGFARLAVKDRGEGISPEHIPHLTRRFYRTDPGRSRAAGGTGLGLAIVKHIVERHRGRLDISSKQGQGTTVTVRFPTIVEDTGHLS
ncbi:MAG: ATP-binding protein [Novosphingobium sp.]|uniref:ATP-binding protein n=1 Tax=Tsuneonella sp. CC-YZS046 TaxID=3042152 RepID=UPI002D7A33D0|nr:ATP-binding protein [Tsuneonella sp. CC-YZS046]WRO67607.1 ATP-binding protein [Tsuneonella sp. CC-YZS046]